MWKRKVSHSYLLIKKNFPIMIDFAAKISEQYVMKDRYDFAKSLINIENAIAVTQPVSKKR